eukprot:m.66451 g.66451  ORF g.66451 m.66451 type:complete len:130 (-) comp15946_c0_seq9:40-429(-)
MSTNDSPDAPLQTAQSGTLSFIATTARPDVAFAVSALGQVAKNPSKTNLKHAVRALGYLNGGPISWRSKCQHYAALSTQEAEVVAAKFTRCVNSIFIGSTPHVGTNLRSSTGQHRETDSDENLTRHNQR